MRRTWVVVIGLSALLCACGNGLAAQRTGSEESAVSPRLPQDKIHSAPDGPTELTCASQFRSVATIDYFVRHRGPLSTFDEALNRLVDRKQGESAFVDSKNDAEAHAFILRADGTAHTSVDLLWFEDRGWAVNTVESCTRPPSAGN